MGRKRSKIIDTIETPLSVKELADIIRKYEEVIPTALVYIRQCEGTDFPPYLSIERI